MYGRHLVDRSTTTIAMATIPEQTLLSGYKIPCVGLGTWKSKPGEVGAAVKTAIGLGYRHLDCAFIYRNEKEVGQAIKEVIDEGTVKREDLFITTKLWNTYHSKARVLEGCKESLTNLDLDYIDLFLMHWPIATRENVGLYPKTLEGKFDVVDIDFVDTWAAMQDLVDQGLCKSLGVSNFNSKQIQRILDLGLKHPLTCNQIEMSPYHSNEKMQKFCKSKGIVVVAYSPLGSPQRSWAKPDDPILLEEPEIVGIAAKSTKSPAQVVLRWGLQRGFTVIPKSVTAVRIKQNIEKNQKKNSGWALFNNKPKLEDSSKWKRVYKYRVSTAAVPVTAFGILRVFQVLKVKTEIFDFKLTDDEMKAIHGINRNARSCTNSDAAHSPYYPFHEEF